MSEKTSAEFEIKEVSIREDVFVKVPASELSLDDEFMNYFPQTKATIEFKERVKAAIQSGMKDFWRSRYDPSLDDDGHICFVSGKRPAVGKSYNWWEENTKKYAPECGSRLGTKSEYIAFLAVLIKKLVASGWTMANAWHVVCIDSKNLGHYLNSKNAKNMVEDTGCREVCGFFDLANIRKILAGNVEDCGFWIASGSYDNYGDTSRLASLYADDDRNYEWNEETGWIVLESCPDC